MGREEWEEGRGDQTSGKFNKENEFEWKEQDFPFAPRPLEEIEA